MLALRVFAAFLFALPAAGLAMFLHDHARGVAPYPDGLFGTGYLAAGEDMEPVRTGRVPRSTIEQVDPDVSFARTPRFVETVDPLGEADYAEEPAGGAQFLLFDQQVDATGNEMVSYSRFVIRTVNAAGAEAISSFPIYIDPAMQSLDLHQIRVEREGEMIDLTDNASVDFLRQEESLSQGIFTGGVTALVRVPGIRSGDIADISYSIRQRHPVVGNDHTALFDFGFTEPVGRLHYRSVWPRDRVQFETISFNGEIDRVDTGRQTVLSFGPAPFNPDKGNAYIPPWHHPAGFFIGTRFEDWQDVVDWAMPLYEPVVDDQVQAIADEIMADHAGRGARIAAAVRYAQREVRYFAILFGEGGYQPLRPEQTLRYGEGDCKAKTLLLLSILAAMDIEAHAALVHTSVGRGLDGLPATPSLFDHVIVTLMHEGSRYYFDPTQPEQAGTIETMTQPAFGSALIVAPGTDSLADMPDYAFPAPLVDVTESLVFAGEGPDDAGAALAVNWEFRNAAADMIRALIAQQGEVAILHTMQNLYTGRFEAFEPDGEGGFSDDAAANVITWRWAADVEMRNYATSEAERPTYIVTAHAPSAHVLPVDINNRTAPVLMPFPYHVQQVTRVSVPEMWAGWFSEAQGYEAETAAFTISSGVEIDGTTATITALTHVRQPELLPAEFEAAAAALDLGTYEARAVIIGEQEDFFVSDEASNALFAASWQPYIPEETGDETG